jgi:xanthine permease XanP
MGTRRPSSLLYAVDDRAPWIFAAFSGLQHVALNSFSLGYAILLAREASLSPASTLDFLSMCFLALAVGTALQAVNRGPLGSGYLLPSSFSGIYIGPSLLALKVGGLPLVFGMTIVGGAVEAALSRLLWRLRPYLPPEVAGLVVLFIGIVVGAIGLRYTLGVGADTSPSAAHYTTAAVAAGTMVALNVWGRGIPRLFCVLIGVSVGYVVSFPLGLLGVGDLTRVLGMPVVALPGFSHASWAFDAALILPFAIAGLAGSLSTMASVTLFQKMHDADWRRAEMGSIQRGVLADGCSTMIAGALGAGATSPSTPNVGLITATGVASRRIAWMTAAILVAFSLLPPLTYLFSIMPTAVMGAALLFVSTFILVGGLQIVTSRLIDARRTFVIGGALLGCLTPLLFPELGADTPTFVRTLVSSPLALGTLVALGLNLLFRIGVHKSMSFTLTMQDRDLAAIDDRMRELGAVWGARADVMSRAAFAVQQWVETAADTHWLDGPADVTATFDEFNLDVRVTYRGSAIEMPEVRPTQDEILESDDGVRRLAGYLLRRNADRAKTSASDGRAVVHFRFVH